MPPDSSSQAHASTARACPAGACAPALGLLTAAVRHDATSRSVAPILSILPAMIAGSLSADVDLATPAASLEILLVAEHVPEDIRQELALFKKLAMDFDELRQYALFNFIAVMKVVKKHDKLSSMPLRDTLAGYVTNQPFFTGERLLRAFGNMRRLATQLTLAAHGKPLTSRSELAVCHNCQQSRAMGFVYTGTKFLCPPCLLAVISAAAATQQSLGGVFIGTYRISGLLDTALASPLVDETPETTPAHSCAGAPAPTIAAARDAGAERNGMASDGEIVEAHSTGQSSFSSQECVVYDPNMLYAQSDGEAAEVSRHLGGLAAIACSSGLQDHSIVNSLRDHDHSIVDSPLSAVIDHMLAAAENVTNADAPLPPSLPGTSLPGSTRAAQPPLLGPLQPPLLGPLQPPLLGPQLSNGSDARSTQTSRDPSMDVLMDGPPASGSGMSSSGKVTSSDFGYSMHGGSYMQKMLTEQKMFTESTTVLAAASAAMNSYSRSSHAGGAPCEATAVAVSQHLQGPSTVASATILPDRGAAVVGQCAHGGASACGQCAGQTISQQISPALSTPGASSLTWCPPQLCPPQCQVPGSGSVSMSWAGGSVPTQLGQPLGTAPSDELRNKWACFECHKAKTVCEGRPCRRCQRLGKTCIEHVRPTKRRRSAKNETGVAGQHGAGVKASGGEAAHVDTDQYNWQRTWGQQAIGHSMPVGLQQQDIAVRMDQLVATIGVQPPLAQWATGPSAALMRPLVPGTVPGTVGGDGASQQPTFPPRPAFISNPAPLLTAQGMSYQNHGPVPTVPVGKWRLPVALVPAPHPLLVPSSQVATPSASPKPSTAPTAAQLSSSSGSGGDAPSLLPSLDSPSQHAAWAAFAEFPRV